MHTRLFGTDGIRGRAGEGSLTPEAVSALGRALGHVVGSAGEGRVLLAHDGRESGPLLVRALSSGLAEAGVSCHSAGLLPTPGLAWLTRELDFTAGLMVSASHNPAADNGIKVFNGRGSKLGDDQEDAIQAQLESDPRPATADAGDLHDPELEQRYLDHLCAAVGDLDLAGVELAVDCANGAGSRTGPAMLRKLGATVHEVATAPDGTNINRGCGSTHPEQLQRVVAESGCSLGIALDGDGDRCLLADGDGQLIDGDAILLIMARRLAELGQLPNSSIVATVMSNRGLHTALEDLGIGVHTVGVGDRRVVEGMRQRSLLLGGEQSGHVIFADGDHYSGDGLLTGLRVLGAMSASGRSLAELAADFTAFPQVLVNVEVASKPPFEELEGVLESVTEIERELAGRGRVLLRYSGTEGLARVMVEGPDKAWIGACAEGLAQHIRSLIGA